MEAIKLSEYLRDAINLYLKKKSHSLMTLSSKSGIHYNTLSRIVKGQVDQPSMETTLGILKICESKHEIPSTMSRFFPDYGALFDKPSKQVLPDLPLQHPDILSDHLCLRILLAIASRKEHSVSQLQREFGQAGIKCVERLLDSSIILVEEDELFINQKFFESVDDESALKLLKDSVEFILKSKQKMPLCFHMIGLNDSGLELVNEYLEEASHKIKRVFEDEKYCGHHPVFMAFVCGVLGELQTDHNGQWYA